MWPICERPGKYTHPVFPLRYFLSISAPISSDKEHTFSRTPILSTNIDPHWQFGMSIHKLLFVFFAISPAQTIASISSILPLSALHLSYHLDIMQWTFMPCDLRVPFSITIISSLTNWEKGEQNNHVSLKIRLRSVICKNIIISVPLLRKYSQILSLSFSNYMKLVFVSNACLRYLILKTKMYLTNSRCRWLMLPKTKGRR